MVIFSWSSTSTTDKFRQVAVTDTAALQETQQQRRHEPHIKNKKNWPSMTTKTDIKTQLTHSVPPLKTKTT